MKRHGLWFFHRMKNEFFKTGDAIYYKYDPMDWTNRILIYYVSDRKPPKFEFIEVCAKRYLRRHHGNKCTISQWNSLISCFLKRGFVYQSIKPLLIEHTVRTENRIVHVVDDSHVPLCHLRLRGIWDCDVIDRYNRMKKSRAEREAKKLLVCTKCGKPKAKNDDQLYQFQVNGGRCDKDVVDEYAAKFLFVDDSSTRLCKKHIAELKSLVKKSRQADEMQREVKSIKSILKRNENESTKNNARTS